MFYIYHTLPKKTPYISIMYRDSFHMDSVDTVLLFDNLKLLVLCVILHPHGTLQFPQSPVPVTLCARAAKAITKLLCATSLWRPFCEGYQEALRRSFCEGTFTKLPCVTSLVYAAFVGRQ